MDKLSLDFEVSRDGATVTGVVTKHARGICGVEVDTALLVYQDTLNTFLCVHPEEELGINSGLIGTVIREHGTISKTGVKEVCSTMIEYRIYTILKAFSLMIGA